MTRRRSEKWLLILLNEDLSITCSGVKTNVFQFRGQAYIEAELWLDRVR